MPRHRVRAELEALGTRGALPAPLETASVDLAALADRGLNAARIAAAPRDVGIE